MYKCGITGSSGLLGKILIKKVNFKFIKFKYDITNKKKVYNWIKRNNFDFIIHLAAIVPTKKVENNFYYSKKVNYGGTKNLVDAIIKYKKKPKLFFFASTSHVYKPKSKYIKILEKEKTKPFSKYGKTKLLAEKYLKLKLSKKKINYCIGRIFSFTDKNQDHSFIVPSLFNKIKKSKSSKIYLKNLNHYRDFVSTIDICKAIEILCKKKKTGIYNIGNGNKISLIQIAKYFSKKYKKKIIIQNNIKKNSFLIASNRKILKTGWVPRTSFSRDLKKFSC